MRLLYLVVPIAIMVSCEKEPLSESTDTQTSDLQSVELEAIPENVTLADVTATVTDGMLTFVTVRDYRIAKRAIANATSKEYLAWQSSLGFKSQYARYSELMELMESQEIPLSKNDLVPSDRTALYIDQEQGLKLTYPDFLMSKLLNMEGRVVIEGYNTSAKLDHELS